MDGNIEQLTNLVKAAAWKSNCKVEDEKYTWGSSS